ncbi:hypothetical protein Pmani_017632 [Petrolisthes manimaculis]|uniref:Glycogen debranching enzyme n=1 Tax=Petrolisthes manimaculis TaxID=1843537 RepID=A0AAE1PP18_9EUCA|nr:hypothetical protein Pmani_017632 [Petrolisthes manimaculis]
MSEGKGRGLKWKPGGGGVKPGAGTTEPQPPPWLSKGPGAIKKTGKSPGTELPPWLSKGQEKLPGAGTVSKKDTELPKELEKMPKMFSSVPEKETGAVAKQERAELPSSTEKESDAPPKKVPKPSTKPEKVSDAQPEVKKIPHEEEVAVEHEKVPEAPVKKKKKAKAPDAPVKPKKAVKSKTAVEPEENIEVVAKSGVPEKVPQTAVGSSRMPESPTTPGKVPNLPKTSEALKTGTPSEDIKDTKISPEPGRQPIKPIATRPVAEPPKDKPEVTVLNAHQEGSTKTKQIATPDKQVDNQQDGLSKKGVPAAPVSKQVAVLPEKQVAVLPDKQVAVLPDKQVAVPANKQVVPENKVAVSAEKQATVPVNKQVTILADTNANITEDVGGDRKLTNFFKMGVQEGAGVVTHEPQSRSHTTGPTTNAIPPSSHPDVKTSGRVGGGSVGQQQPQVRVLTLNHGDHLDSTLFRLQKGWVLQLRPGPSLLGRAVSVFTNHPEDPSEGFTRSRYRRLRWMSDSRNKGDDTALYVEVTLSMPGSFHYYFTYEDGSEDRVKAEGSGFFLVDPVLTVGMDNQPLPQDCIQCQTVLSKCLGPLPDWEQRIQVAYETGYNMVHFTPIQELGASNSSYSLKDQHALNTEFHTPNHQYNFSDVEAIIRKMKDEWKMLSLTDIVLNHTANETPWLQQHPDATYNCSNCPHLRPAFLLDRALCRASKEVAEGKWDDQGIPVAIREEKHVEAIKNMLHTHFLPQIKIHEFYTVDVDRIVEEFRRRISGHIPVTTSSGKQIKEGQKELVINQDPQYRRRACTVDMNIAVRLYNLPSESKEKNLQGSGPEAPNEEERIVRCCADLRRRLEDLNEQRASEIQAHLIQAIECCLGTIKYQRLQPDGPMIAEVSEENPLVPPYFTHPGKDITLEEEEALMFSPDACFLMAHNGWVMGDDPLKNFARKESFVYLRRELVAWGDSVKLRYGEKPEDSPYLWDLMRRYCEYTAKLFHGVRLDNCHSTPIHVAEYMLDAARKVRPELYVIAELFTNSDLTDNIFINRLGINSLVREAMSAPNSHEEGRLVYRYGGEPVGAFLLPPVRPLVPSVAHAMFLDLTHDNRSPAEVRTAWDMLPSAALVNMACCASGSNRGYDELVPHHIHVVDEQRVYNAWNDSEPERGEVGIRSGIIKCKKLLNNLHYELGSGGFNQVFVDQVTEHVVTVTRHNPVTHQSVVLVAYTSFQPPSQIRDSYIRPLKVQGRLEEIIFEMQIKGKKPGDEEKNVPGFFTADSEYINGLFGFDVSVRERLRPEQSTFVRVTSDHDAEMTECEYTSAFTPGSVIAFRLSLLPRAQSAVNKIRASLSEFGYKSRISEVTTHNSTLSDIVESLGLVELNRVLYRCQDEEQDEGRGWGAYNIPNSGPLMYCGLQGMISVLSEIRVQNDLGHPLCGNLREGDWLPDYLVGRLKLEPSTQRLASWLEEVFGWLKDVPRYLIPAYFDSIVTSIYLTLINRAWSLMGEFVAQGSDFVKALSLCSVQFCGTVKSALLPPLSPNLLHPQPPTVSDPMKGQIQLSATIAAGLPHFSVGYMRNWGRDTFIALPGNLLITGRYNEARWIILAFAGTLRHGLIPNLLDGGQKARFNCRDSVWFWLQAIQRYVTMAPEGHHILKDKVSRLFPNDDSTAQEPGKHDQLLEDVIQESLQRHFQGVSFRERNAGHQIDREMCDQGFNNRIGVDLETGFVYGGSIHNCGTWMDKMGSSELAGTKGKPATPRDGSAVEIVGLCKSALHFLGQMHREGKFNYNSVERRDDTGNVTKWTYEFWEKKIQENFERHFWINETPIPEMEPKPELINRRGMYKDSYNASQFWADYQLRCNFPIAIAAAPEMVNPQHAWTALKKAEEVLLGPLGMRTLDPSDWGYNGDYDNSNNSTDPKLAHGYNYHQGPEWLWPVGWLLRAQLAIAPKVGGFEELGRTMGHVKALTAPHLTHLLTSPWRSLPELTNSNGSLCRDSNPAQSWSTGCVLEVLWELDHIERGLKRSNRQHRRLSVQSQHSALDSAFVAPQTSKIVITTKNVDPSTSFVKEVEVGDTVICYVPRNVVFSEEPNFFETVHDVVHVKCSQSDINFSMALIAKPYKLQENCLVVWAVDDRIRRHAMWSSPEEYADLKYQKPPVSVKQPWFRGRGVAKGRLLHPSSRGPVMTGPVYQTAGSGSKKYQGRVPSIVALLTSHAKSHYKAQKNVMQQSEVPQQPQPPYQDSCPKSEKAYWQQKRYAPVSQEIHKAMAENKPLQEAGISRRGNEKEDISETSVRQKIDIFKERGYGFSYHLNPPTTTGSLTSRPSVLNLPPPPQIPLPPVPENSDPAIPGPSSRSGPMFDCGQPSVLDGGTGFKKSHETSRPHGYKAQKMSESVSFVNPYARQVDCEPFCKDMKPEDASLIITPHSERQWRESTCLFIQDDIVKPRPINKQKLSAVLVLSLFVAALTVFYLVYFL